LAYPLFKATQEISLIQYVFVHEFGHLFDFANNLNHEVLSDPSCLERVKNDEDYERECHPTMKPGSWGDISWRTPSEVRPEKDFFGRNLLCFYGCETYINTETEMIPFYQGLSTSDFVSSYGASNYADDLAEAWAARWLHVKNKGELQVEVSPTFEVNLSNIYNSDNFSQKRLFLENFAASEVKYP
jgi:hypothetical protein